MSPFDRLYEIYENRKTDQELIANEAQVSRSLVAPFFRDALGWDIEHPDEFKYEHNVGGKRIDILACIDGISQFVIEVKSMAHEVRDSLEFYKQAIQYADGKGKKYAILTNFKEFVILRTDIQPKEGNWLTLEVDHYTIEQLLKDLALMRYFRKSVWAGDKKELDELDRAAYASYDRRKPVDERLLDLFVDWRETCLSWLKKKKPALFEQYATEYIEEEVQRFLDRIIFATSCEDRGIEEVELRQYIPRYRNSLRIEGHFVTRGIRQIFERYYSRYDSDLFDRGLADTFEFDDEVTYGILRDIKSPKDELAFDFSTIAPDILGKTYENFIGHLTRGRKNLEEVSDFEIRKQEGIYYTPQWVVEQIVSKTVRDYVRGKTLDELHDVKILDPACGSGPFLITAFRELLDYAKSIAGQPLEYSEKKKLFLSCIHGVDKDDRACDIAKLNISLELAMGNRKLPSLSKSIQCGDSLMLKEVEGYSKSMEWEKRFPDAFNRKNPGFDIIIGNPPYLSTKDFDEDSKYQDVLKEEFGELNDLFYLFIRLNDLLVRSGGIWGFIVPNTFFTLTHYRGLRNLLESRYDTYLIDLSPNVFKEAYVFNAITVARRTPNQSKALRIGFVQRETATQVETRELLYDEISRYPKMPFFYPNDIFDRYDKRILRLAGAVYFRFEKQILNANAYKKSRPQIEAQFSSLKPGDITLLGLVAEGSQGLVTGNNSRYLGVVPEDERQRAEIWDELNQKIGENSRGHEHLQYSPGNAEKLYEKAESIKQRLKKPTAFGKKFLYKIIEPGDLREFSELEEAEKKDGIQAESSWIQYFRGNEAGDTWKVKNPEYICWSREYVKELKEKKVTNSRWQGVEYFFKPGFGWVDYFDERIKGFFVEPTVYGKNVVKFHSQFLPDEYILGLLNSSYVPHYVKHYITNTRTLQINDGKLIPIAIADAIAVQDVVKRVREILALKSRFFETKDGNELARLTAQIATKESELDDGVFRIYGFDATKDKDAIDSIKGESRGRTGVST